LEFHLLPGDEAGTAPTGRRHAGDRAADVGDTLLDRALHAQANLIPGVDPEACRLTVPGERGSAERHHLSGGDVLAGHRVRGEAGDPPAERLPGDLDFIGPDVAGSPGELRPGPSPRQREEFLRPHLQRFLCLIGLPWLHVGLVPEVAQKSPHVRCRSCALRYIWPSACEPLYPLYKPFCPGLGYALPQDGGPVLLPEMIDFKGFRVHTASPTKRYRDSAGYLPYSMLGSK